MITFGFHREGYTLISIPLDSCDDVLSEIDAFFGTGMSDRILYSTSSLKKEAVMLLSDEYFSFVNSLNISVDHYPLCVDYSPSFEGGGDVDSFSVVVWYLVYVYNLLYINEINISRKYSSNGVDVDYIISFSPDLNPEVLSLIQFFKSCDYYEGCYVPSMRCSDVSRFSLTLKRLFFDDIPRNLRSEKKLIFEDDDGFYTSEEYLKMIEG